MPTNFENLEMGPCTVNYKTTDLGLTKGGVEVAVATEVSQITADQFGASVIDDVIQGRQVTVKVPMAERDLEKLTLVFPGSTLVDDGADNKKLVINASVGTSLRALAGPLILHPKAVDEADLSKDVVVPLASAKGDLSYTYTSEDQRVYTAEFTGYVDLDTDEIVTFGDPSIVAP